MSHVFDDSEDEFEDDYTESIKLINKLEKELKPVAELQLEPEPELEPDAKLKSLDNVEAVEESKSQRVEVKITPNKSYINLAESVSSNATVRTRSSNRLKNIVETKAQVTNAAYGANGTIEVLMEEIDDDQDIEYVIADVVENDEPFQSTDSNDEINTLIDDTAFENDPFVLQTITKTDELDISEESIGDKSMEDEETGNPKFLTLYYVQLC